MKQNNCFWKPYLLLFSICKSLLLPIFRRKLNIFHCFVCAYYAFFTYFLKKILKNSTFVFFQPNLQGM